MHNKSILFVEERGRRLFIKTPLTTEKLLENEKLWLEVKKGWQEQPDTELLQRYVCGIDPYKSGESEVYCWALGGEHSPYITKRDTPKFSHGEIKHTGIDMGGAHQVRRAAFKPQVRYVRDRDAEINELYGQAIARITKEKPGIDKTIDGVGEEVLEQ
jgi:hypothetical protein